MPTLLDIAFAKETLLACNGFNPSFIDGKTMLNIHSILTQEQRNKLPEVEGNTEGILNYSDMSVCYNAIRKIPFFSAYNIDGALETKEKIKRTTFRTDPRIPKTIQLNQTEFYDLIKNKTEFEIGHMAANMEMAWGKEAQIKTYQTFHFPNSVPQAENLNTGLWKTLESYIIKETSSIDKNKKIAVFSGPIMLDNDPKYIMDPTFRIPLLFFKVIVFSTEKGLFSTAFVMSHEQKIYSDGLVAPLTEKAAAKKAKTFFDDFKYKKVFQVSIELLNQISGLNFTFEGIQPVAVPNDKNQLKKIKAVKDASDLKGKAALTNKTTLNLILP